MDSGAMVTPATTDMPATEYTLQNAWPPIMPTRPVT